MPYRRKARRPAKRPFRSHRRAPKAVKRYVKNAISSRLEHKHALYYDTGFSVTATPGVTDLSSSSAWAIIPGTSSTTRVGDQVRLVRLNCRMGFLCGDNYNTIRIVLFRWKGSNATAPVAADILDSSGPEWVFAPYNLANSAKYHIVYDKVIGLQNTYASTSAGAAGSGLTLNSGSWKVVRPFALFGKRLGAKNIYWDSGSNNNGSQHFYRLIVSDSVVTPNPQVMETYQLVYTDA